MKRGIPNDLLHIFSDPKDLNAQSDSAIPPTNTIPQSPEKSSAEDKLITVYGKKKDVLFEKTAYEPEQTMQEMLETWKRNGIDVGEVATSSGVAVHNNGTEAKPPLSGPTSNNTIPQSPKKSSAEDKPHTHFPTKSAKSRTIPKSQTKTKRSRITAKKSAAQKRILSADMQIKSI